MNNRENETAALPFMFTVIYSSELFVRISDSHISRSTAYARAFRIRNRIIAE
jgi:hypothetical protein